MLFVSYLLFIVIALLALRANPERWGRHTSVLLRIITGAVAALAGCVAILLLTADYADHTTPAIVLLSGLLLGSIAHLSGLLLWRGTLAFTLRVIGWILLVIPALVPSTLSLALPMLAVLALTISLVPSPPATWARHAPHATG